MAEAGRPTELTEELFDKIKQSIIDGNDLRKTASVCGINEGTLYQWHSKNYSNISDKIEGWKRDRLLMLANRNIEGILALGISDKETTKVVADMSKFVAETLGKKDYAKRTENTGADGKALIPIVSINYVQPGSDNNTKTNEETTPSV